MLHISRSVQARAFAAAFALLGCTVGAGAQTPRQAARLAPAPAVYFPERFEWQTKTPEQAGMDAARLDAAIKFAIASENPATKDLAVDLATTSGASRSTRRSAPCSRAAR